MTAKSFEEWWEEFKKENDGISYTPSAAALFSWGAALAQRDAEVCEWSRYKEQEPNAYNAANCKTECGSISSKYNFCPFCGRKIKVVEGEGK